MKGTDRQIRKRQGRFRMAVVMEGYKELRGREAIRSSRNGKLEEVTRRTGYEDGFSF